MSATWIERWPLPPGDGPVVAVKDLIDVAGSPTTAGCRAVASSASPAVVDAPCIERVRAAGGRLAGKTNLHELAYGTTGINPWYGTPANPADPGRVPGGSSSGSAVAVADGEVDVALGSDTGGSVRIPAACCGVVGLKTTWGRIPLDGVWPLGPSLDTVGPLGRDVRGVVTGMTLLEGTDFDVSGVELPPSTGLASLPGVEIDPVILAAVVDAVRVAELAAESVVIEGWQDAGRTLGTLLDFEAWASDRHLVERPGRDGIGADVLERLLAASRTSSDAVVAARAARQRWVDRLGAIVARFGVVALPTLPIRPPLVDDLGARGFNGLTSPVNLAGFPAISLPVPAAGRPPTGLQLIGPPGGEELLCAVALRVEAAVAR